MKTVEIIKSWKKNTGLHTINQVFAWIEKLNHNTQVNIEKSNLSDSNQWFYDPKMGSIHNKNNSFFQIVGLQKIQDGRVIQEQPILIQDEIGYLGIICKNINGVLHFLMQAKIEPGNVNYIQLSPTIQATKSNFTQKHGGTTPAYLDYFTSTDNYEIIVDQIQSEQSSRFLGKRNRNIILYVSENEDIEILPNFMWLTLGQIKQLLRKDNIVNMDTRTVLSCIPFSLQNNTDEELKEIKSMFTDKAFFKSIFEKPNKSMIPQIYNNINNYKMFDETETKIVTLTELSSWEIKDNNIKCKYDYPFFVTFCDIAIDGREVKQWTQPLFEAVGMAEFGLFTTIKDNRRLFLIKGLAEIGSFDKIELAPTIQLEAGYAKDALNNIDKLFMKKYEQKQGVLYDVILSEEGGRFYHEENYNRIIEVGFDEIVLPTGYFWVDYYTLNLLNQVNNCLNIQLRNLLSLLDV